MLLTLIKADCPQAGVAVVSATTISGIDAADGGQGCVRICTSQATAAAAVAAFTSPSALGKDDQLHP